MTGKDRAHIHLAVKSFEIGSEAVEDRNDVLLFRRDENLFGESLKRFTVLMK